NNIVLVRMAQDATADDEITISYTKPSEKPIQTLGGKVVPSIPTTAVVNNTLPKIKTSLINDQNQSLVTLNFDTELANIVPDISAFGVKINSTVVNITNFSLSRKVITMTLSKSAFANDTVKISYTKPTTDVLQSPKGKQVANLVDYVVTNEVTPKPLRSVINDGSPNFIRVVFDAAMAKIYPPLSSFTVTRNGKKDNILSFNTSGTVLYLKMAEDVYADDEITVSYVKSSTKPLQSQSGNEANSFSNIVSTNNTTPKVKNAIINNNDPSLITMEFTSLLNESEMPDISAFNVKVNGSSVSDPDISIRNNNLLFKFRENFEKTDNVKVSYTKPTANELQSPKGSLVTSFTDYQVINNLYQLDTLKASMTLYPNPANEHFFIKLEANDKLPAIVNCRIIDISGKVLYTTKISTDSPQSMSLSDIKRSGIYIIQLYIEKTTLASEKLVVIKSQ
ncbi:MAG: T9SS type A sorting domain-containing protein, partial [Bacteroidales bacterium]|nr:T9SS type A sorting domain-containing protein [Bacteroidales bacterium]